MLRNLLFLFAVTSIIFLFADAAIVKNLPGLSTPLKSALYSGYITVDASHNRRLFYMFIESEKSPLTDPIILWLNGGPGCSSLFGFFSESGPVNMNFTSNGKGLVHNPYSWSTVASVIYLEAPAGVGYSTSNVPGDYTTGDEQTAVDNLAFLVGFFKEFPQFQRNPFYVAGESYGGHYVPELVYAIQKFNNKNDAEEREKEEEEKKMRENNGELIFEKEGTGRGKKSVRTAKINLAGMMAGNPWTDPITEAFGIPEYWWWHGIISEKVYTEINTYCDYKDITHWIVENVSTQIMLSVDSGSPSPAQVSSQEFLSSTGGKKNERQTKMSAKKPYPSVKTNNNNNSTKCYAALTEACKVQFGGVDILGIYLDVCNKGTKGNIPDQPNYCSGGQVTTYLNLPEVRTALHVTAPIPTWSICSSVVHYSPHDTTTSVLYIYEEILKNTKLHVLVYSGDNDAIVPFTATRKWLKKLNRPILNDVHEWWSNTNGPQVGGWAVRYDRLTFTTVRQGGHMVPFVEPQRALHMIRTFLDQHYL